MIEILNDHWNLMYIQASQNQNGKHTGLFSYPGLTSPSSTYLGNTLPFQTLSHQTDHLTKEEDNCNQVMLPANKFYESSKLNESLAATGDDPSHVTLEGKEASFLKCICDCADRDDTVV